MTKADLTEQKKQTAIRNIAKGENFTRKKFKAYWNDKECFRLGVVTKPHIIDFDIEKTMFENWWKSWRWDEEFVTELFFEILKKHNTFLFDMFPDSILEQLPESVTNDIGVAKHAAIKGVTEYFDHLGPNITDTQHEIKPEYRQNTIFCHWLDNCNFWNQTDFVKTPEWEMYAADPDLAARDIENGPQNECCVPFTLIRASKRLSAIYVRSKTRILAVPRSYFGDIDFVCDCLGPNPSPELIGLVFRRLPYSTKKFIGMNDPVRALKVLQNLNHLTDLPESIHVDSPTKPAPRVNKI